MIATMTEALSPYQLERWQCLKNDNRVEHRFVFMLSPILEFIYQTIHQHIQSLPTVALLLENFALEAWLRNDLCNIFHPMLSRSCVLEMHYAKQAGHLTGDTSELRFRSFIELLQSNEFVRYFMGKYHVLQGIIDRRVTHYVHALSSFLVHLDQDFEKVSKYLLSANDQMNHFKLNKLSSDGADVHCQGKRVFILDFLDTNHRSLKLVYKPHQLDPEELFNHLIEWFNQYSPESSLLPMKLMNNDDHGWVEYIAHTPCENEEAVKLFYCRAGHLLAFLYMFHGIDIHYENLIAHGSYPVMVDLECFLTPNQSHNKENILRYSLPTVLSALFLPYKTGHDKESPGIDMSALGFSGGKTWFNKKFGWENQGTDEMRFARMKLKSSPSFNRPFLKKIEDVNLLHYEQELLQGFEKAYFIILNHVETSFLKEKISVALEKLHIRLVFRATAEYGQLLLESYHPSLLKDTDAYQKHLEWLSEEIEENTGYPFLIPSELLDLSAGDIPFFSTQVNNRAVYNSYFEETGYITKKSGLELMRWRMKNIFSKQDCYRQCHLIQMSFELAKQNKARESNFQIDIIKKVDHCSASIDLKNIAPQALNHAEKILDDLVDLAFIENNQITWPDVRLDQETVHYSINPSLTEKTLYSGNLGILLVFLHGNRQIQKPSYERVIRKCLKSIHIDILSGDSAAWLKNIGAFSGAAGVLYVLEQARELSYSIDNNIEERLLKIIENNLAEDISYDIISGSAGLILALMKRQAREESPLIVDLIRQSIQHLLNDYPHPATLPESWKEQYYFPSPGFSHGVAGIAWALWQARSVFSNQETEQWIERALIYITNVHDQHGYFPDFRKLGDESTEEKEQYPHSPFWCHGHIGIGLFYSELHRQHSPLAKLAPMHHIFDEMTSPNKIKSNGCLCCGSLGELAFLWQLYQHDPSKMKQSNQKLLKNMIAHLFDQLSKKEYSDFTIGAGFSINLMQGRAGIAYILLNMAPINMAANFLLLS